MIFPPNSPIHDIIDGLNTMLSAVYNKTGQKGITRLSVSSEFGLAHGILPGTVATVNTSCGSVEIYCERALDIEYEFGTPKGYWPLKP